MSQEKLKAIQSEALEAFLKAENTKNLYDLKVKFLGKNGSLTSIMKEMGKLSAEERPLFGKMVNEVKVILDTKYEEVESLLKKKEMSEKLQSEALDLTLPGPKFTIGSQHPVQKVMDEFVDILSRLGYAVRTGPLIEKDRYNFEALNIPKDHPARDMQDTFYVDENHVLRTQTSPIQIHTLENEKPPLRILGPGAVFRHDYDISHLPMFHQVEGMMVDKKVSMADLKGTVSFFIKEFFGKNLKTRFRPSFFPFTEPSAEVDCTCPICAGKGCSMCGHSGWVEVGGCGLIHPHVLKEAGVDPKEWQGFAFGFGVERLAVVKYGVEDIRLFIENDTRFLTQFK